MLNLQEPLFDHPIASALPWPVVFSSRLFTFGWSSQRNHLQCHGLPLAITWYTMASVHKSCEGSQHFIENECDMIFIWMNF